MKHVDYATWEAVKAVADGTFKPGVITLSLSDGGVGYAQDNVAKVLSADQMAKVEALRQDIIDGTVVPPTDPKAVPAWTPPSGF
jgi:basic membrane lipoprotein Med (substrate-binding protein (PBP1-ABC) superfamily)